MAPIKIPSELLEQIGEHAVREYPFEACGLLLGPEKKPQVISRWIPCVNAQDKYHLWDAALFPRTAHNAYFIEPLQLLKVQKEARATGESLRGIVHSHPDSDAVFSNEDQKMAAPAGEPLYPDVFYLVVSVQKGKISQKRNFFWSPNQRKFV